jgi:hypothetical protein
MNSFQDMPELHQQFHNAQIVDVIYGPRQEFTLTCHRLIWQGQTGHLDKSITSIRFGGVMNLDNIKQFFDTRPYEISEVYLIDYAKDHISKMGRIFVDVSFERIEARQTIECRNITISYID